MIVVFSKPGCVQCNATYRHLENKHNLVKDVDFKVVDVSLDFEAADDLRDRGFQKMPVVVIDDNWGGSFTGFQPDLLDKAVLSS